MISKINLDFLENKFIALTHFSENPILFHTIIKKVREHFVLNIELQQYYQLPFSKMLQFADFKICPTSSLNLNCKVYRIISQGTLANTIRRYNQSWSREWTLPSNIKLSKGESFFFIVWSVTNIGRNHGGLSSNTINLNSYQINK